MSKRRWLKKVIETAKTEPIKAPWARGSQRKAWKDAARSRAKAA